MATQMKAPPSTKKEIVDVPFAYRDLVSKYSPGGLILEVPGESHTLVTEHPNGVKLFGWMEGPIEFYDENAVLVETADVWWMMNHYEEHCKEHGIPINPKLYL